MKILVLNCGSSSLKYQLMNMEGEEVLGRGTVERIGDRGSNLLQKVPGRADYKKEGDIPGMKEAVQWMFRALTDKKAGIIEDLSAIDAVGHRILHGGEEVFESSLIDGRVRQAITDNIKFGPLHNPAQLEAVDSCIEILGKDKPQVAVFDTAFHQTMPEENYIYPIPYRYYEDDHIRRYGFHGTSHRYIAGRTAELLGIPLDRLNIISCHLGNGCSVAAIQNGRCENTSMGLTPLAGLPMGTRSGDIDPAIIFYMMKEEGLSADEMDHLLNKESGFYGLTGGQTDFRDLLKGASEGDPRCRLTIRLFSNAVRRYIGGYALELGRLDAVVFTGGIGEHQWEARKAICENLEMIGAVLDAEKNRADGPAERELSKDGSAVKIWVVPTNEELMIARDAQRIAQELGA